MNSTRGQETDDFPPLLVKIISAVYGIISLGFFSNLAVAVVVGNILVRLGRHLPNRHMLVYVLALCIVDALVLGTLPMLITQLYLQKWIFGQTLCTVYWTIESINKTLSTFILTCLSFDRYLAVRFPQRCLHIRTVRGALYILCSCIVFAALLLMPVYLHTEITYVPIDADENRTATTVPTCAFVGQSSFLFTVFTLCYVVPFACMSCFYGSMLARLRHKSRKLGLRQGRVRRVTKKTLTLVLLYFMFWTPYWIMTMKSVIYDALYKTDNDSKSEKRPSDDHDQHRSSVFPSPVFPANRTESAEVDVVRSDVLSEVAIAVMLVIHSGCYLNSAINPILYALLNRELRRQHYAAMNTTSRNNSIPINANANGQANCGVGRNSVNGAPHKLPLILCTSVDGNMQIRWDEAPSDVSSYRSVTPRVSVSKAKRYRKSRSWIFWQRPKANSSAGLHHELSVGDSRRSTTTTTTTLYSRLISITTMIGDRNQAWPESSGKSPSPNSPHIL